MSCLLISSFAIAQGQEIPPLPIINGVSTEGDTLTSASDLGNEAQNLTADSGEHPAEALDDENGEELVTAESGEDDQLDADADLDDEDDLDDELDSLLEKDLGSLRQTSVAPALDVEVSSVSRQKSTIGRSPAAVYVVTADMIRRSGYRSVPEVLRLVPGVQVARIDGNKWSISVREDGSRFSDKLLVQIDGRTVYNPLFAGVLWEIQDLLLEDILRIEVIRGPGATVWGANAVTGVINILTKSASETHGTYAIGGSGTLERGFTGARIGGQTKGGIDYRVWGKWFDRDETDLVGRTPNDSIRQGRIGFRTDWSPDSIDSITFQGQYYDGRNNNLVDRTTGGVATFQEPVNGGHLLLRWVRTHSQDNESQFQFYYDNFQRLTRDFDQNTNIIDFDFQNRFRWRCDHSLIWGLGYRAIFDRHTNDAALPFISMNPERFTVQRFSGFIQDEMTLIDDKLYFTLGTKLSHNTFSNFEIQPSARLLWLPNETSAAWGAVSRAVRTPARATAHGRVNIDQNPPLGPFPLFAVGNADLPAENLTAYELGYRQQTNEWFSWDVTGYFHKLDDLLATSLVIPGAGFPFLQFIEGPKGDAYGIEISMNAQLTANWKVTGWYTAQSIDFDEQPPAITGSGGTSGSLARNQFSIMQSFDLCCGREWDVISRYVDNLPDQSVPSYFAVDTRFAWNVSPSLTASVVGRNLFDRRHPEFGSSQYTGEVATEIPRSLHAYLEWRR